jgi:hypothetical protein
MFPSVKWQLILRKYNGDFTVINLGEEKRLTCYETWLHNMKPGFKKINFHVNSSPLLGVHEDTLSLCWMPVVQA